MKQDDVENILSFEAVEKDIYIDPPKLAHNTPDDIKLIMWQEWQKKDDRKRRAHKASITRKLKAVEPDYEVSTYKSGGVHKQKIGAVNLEGDSEEFSHIIAVPATQDRHFQPRGKRAGDKKRNKAKNRKKKSSLKSQKILNARSK